MEPQTREGNPENGGGREPGCQPVKSTLERSRSRASPSHGSPTPRGPAGLLPVPAGIGGGAGWWPGHLPPPPCGLHASAPRPPACALPAPGRSAPRSPPPGRQVHRGCADENTPSLAAPLTAGDSPHSGCPLAARLRGPVPAARVCGSRPAAHYLARKESRTAEESVLTEGVEPASLPVTCSHRGGDPASLLVAGGLGDTTIWVSV